MEHQAAQQLASSLSGTSGGKSRKKAAKKKLASLGQFDSVARSCLRLQATEDQRRSPLVGPSCLSCLFSLSLPLSILLSWFSLAAPSAASESPFEGRW